MEPIKFTRRDGSHFALQPTIPMSFQARYDLAAEMEGASRSQMLRLCAAALGLTCVGQHPPGGTVGQAMPVYRNNGDLMSYGGQVVDLMAGQWGVVPGKELWEQALKLSTELVASLPTSEGVSDKRDFT